MKQIARLCAVSEGTVSKALCGKPGVNEQTRARIASIARQYHYRPNALVRSIQSSRTMTVGVACNAFADEYAGRIMSGIMRCLHSNHYEALVLNWDMSVRNGEHVLRAMVERRVDGILMFPPEKIPPPTYLTELRAFHGPVVLIDQKWPGCEYDFVGNEDFQGAFNVTEYLIKAGHRRIGNIFTSSVSSGQDRLDGFREAMSKYGILVDHKWLVDIDPDTDTIEDKASLEARRILSQKDRPTAVVCFNDYVAVGVLNAALDLGIDIPRDLSITGFADIFVARNVRPKLTTIRQDAMGIGFQAGELLLRRIGEKSAEFNVPRQAVNILRPTELVIRGSTAPVNNGK